MTTQPTVTNAELLAAMRRLLGELEELAAEISRQLTVIWPEVALFSTKKAVSNAQ